MAPFSRFARQKGGSHASQARVLSVRPDGNTYDLDIRDGAQARLIAPPAERGQDARQLSLIASSRLAGPLDPEAWLRTRMNNIE